MQQRFIGVLVACAALFMCAPAWADGCKGCAATQQVVERVTAQVRCDGCEEAPAACAKCKAIVAAPACASEACKALAGAKCVPCAATAAVLKTVFCCGGCRKAGEAKAAECAKCKLARKRAERATRCFACHGQSASQDGVTVQAVLAGPMVNVMEDELLPVEGYFTFTVRVSNGNDAKRTLKGKVILLDAEGKEIGSGTLFKPVGAKAATLEASSWKAAGKVASFKLVIEKIFKF